MTKSYSRTLALVTVTVLLVLASNGSALGCPACYNPAGGDKMNHAAQVGIIAMVIIMFGMLGAVAAFGFHLAYRAKHPLPDYSELLTDDDTPQPNPGPAS